MFELDFLGTGLTSCGNEIHREGAANQFLCGLNKRLLRRDFEKFGAKKSRTEMGYLSICIGKIPGATQLLNFIEESNCRPRRFKANILYEFRGRLVAIFRCGSPKFGRIFLINPESQTAISSDFLNPIFNQA